MVQKYNEGRFALVGNPVAHSYSPLIHSLFAKKMGIEIEYQAICCDVSEFDATITRLVDEGYAGVNITMPFKKMALARADIASPTATLAQAANTLVFNEDLTISANNFDGEGLTQDLLHNHDYCFLNKRILILGAGGAACGILTSLLEQAPRSITIANRNKARAVELTAQLETLIDIQGIGLNELPHHPYDLIIHATSAGITGAPLALPQDIVGANTWCYDMQYGKPAAHFTQWAKAAEAMCILDGIGMLVEQAAAAFYLWHGHYPDTHAIIEQLQATLPEKMT